MRHPLLKKNTDGYIKFIDIIGTSGWEGVIVELSLEGKDVLPSMLGKTTPEGDTVLSKILDEINSLPPEERVTSLQKTQLVHYACCNYPEFIAPIISKIGSPLFNQVLFSPMGSAQSSKPLTKSTLHEILKNHPEQLDVILKATPKAHQLEILSNTLALIHESKSVLNSFCEEPLLSKIPLVLSTFKDSFSDFLKMKQYLKTLNQLHDKLKAQKAVSEPLERFLHGQSIIVRLRPLISDDKHALSDNELDVLREVNLYLEELSLLNRLGDSNENERVYYQLQSLQIMLSQLQSSSDNQSFKVALQKVVTELETFKVRFKPAPRKAAYIGSKATLKEQRKRARQEALKASTHGNKDMPLSRKRSASNEMPKSRQRATSRGSGK